MARDEPDSAAERPPTEKPFQFSLGGMLLSFVAVAWFLGVASCTSTFELLPLVPLGIWFLWEIRRMLNGKRRGLPILAETVVAAAVIHAMLSFAVGTEHGGRAAARRSQCINNLKQITIALHNYHDVYGSFPPACTRDAEGRPMHSWRVLILPFLEGQALYDQYDLAEPWNGPNNRALAALIPPVYQCPANELFGTPTTSYLAIIGPATAWPADGSTCFADMTDGTSNTLLVVESTAGVHWMEPRDLKTNDLRHGVNGDSGPGISCRHECCWRHPRKFACVAIADGSTFCLPNETSPADLRAMATIAGGETVEMQW